VRGPFRQRKDCGQRQLKRPHFAFASALTALSIARTALKILLLLSLEQETPILVIHVHSPFKARRKGCLHDLKLEPFVYSTEDVYSAAYAGTFGPLLVLS
jgi:hypothetical protein